MRPILYSTSLATDIQMPSEPSPHSRSEEEGNPSVRLNEYEKLHKESLRKSKAATKCRKYWRFKLSVTIHINKEYQNLVYPLTEQEYQTLKRSIVEKGFWKSKPIIVNGQGIILDGHHRFQACQELEIEPVISVESFADDLQEKLFVIESNLRRRQLNKFQRTELALKEKPIRAEIARRNSQANLKQSRQPNPASIPSIGYPTLGNGKGRVDQQIADLAGVGKDAVREVEFIVQKAPKELIDRLRRGVGTYSLTIHTVYKKLYNEQV